MKKNLGKIGHASVRPLHEPPTHSPHSMNKPPSDKGRLILADGHLLCKVGNRQVKMAEVITDRSTPTAEPGPLAKICQSGGAEAPKTGDGDDHGQSAPPHIRLYYPQELGQRLREAMGTETFDQRFGTDGTPYDRFRAFVARAGERVKPDRRVQDDSEFSFLLDDRDDPEKAFDLSYLSDDARLRASSLMALARHERGPYRPVIIGNREMRRKLHTLRLEMPQFIAFLTFLDARIALSARTKSGLSIPPILLLGPAGVGKTRLTKKLAAILGTTATEMALSSESDLRTALAGLRPTWRNARAGKISQALIDAPTASPLVILDELEKIEVIGTGRVADPLDALHGLWERENSTNFRDEFLELDFRADGILWVATANNISSVPATILDRLLVLPVSRPDVAAMRTIVHSIYMEANGRVGGAFPRRLDPKIVALLAGETPRTVSQVFDTAMAFAAQEGRLRLTPDMVAAALALITSGKSVKDGLTGPIGFTHCRERP